MNLLKINKMGKNKNELLVTVQSHIYKTLKKTNILNLDRKILPYF